MTRAVTRASSVAPERSLAEVAYERIKARIFDFELLPGDRFTETEMAEALAMSRTPAREALYRLEREGFLQVHLRVGWSVRPFDFRQFEHSYDLRLVLEEASVRRLCELPERPALDALKEVWLVPKAERRSAPKDVAALDEAFHTTLVAAAGNPEVERCHREVTERIRIIRRLDFTQPHRIDRTYDEHAQILRAVIRRRTDEANRLLRSHIEASKAEVRKITVHRLYAARTTSGAVGPA
jgi:DNA-binding GntR family transcriptional regulator